MTVTVPCPPLGDDQGVALTAGWGEQLDVRHLGADHDGGELSAEQVAGYVAKYATKATEALGVTLDQRVTAGDLDDLDGLDLPGARGRARAGLLGAGRPPEPGWAAAAGVGAHARLRRPPRLQEPPLLHHPGGAAPGPGRLRHPPAPCHHRAAGRLGQPDDDQAAVVIATWRYVGAGYQSTGEAWLAASAAARAREGRRITKEELRTTTIAA
jgi:hypothetical protein